MRNKSACCKTKENHRRKRATCVPSAKCWDSFEYVSDLCSTRLMASSLMRACTSEPTSPQVDIIERGRRECVCCHPIILDVGLVDVPVEVTQEEGPTGFLHLPSAVFALFFLARRNQTFLSLVGCKVEFCVLTN